MEENVVVEDGVVVKPQGKGLAIAGLVLGILSVLCCCVGIGAIFGLVGIILSVLALRKMDKKTMAIVALVLSILGLVVGTIVFVIYGMALVEAAPYLNKIDWNTYMKLSPDEQQKYLDDIMNQAQMFFLK